VLGVEHVRLSFSHGGNAEQEITVSAHIPVSVAVINKHSQSRFDEQGTGRIPHLNAGQQPQLGDDDISVFCPTRFFYKFQIFIKNILLT
jgi:hypothetical protein